MTTPTPEELLAYVEEDPSVIIQSVIDSLKMAPYEGEQGFTRADYDRAMNRWIDELQRAQAKVDRREQENQEEVSRLRDCTICRVGSARKKVRALWIALTKSKQVLLCAAHAATKSRVEDWTILPLYDGYSAYAGEIRKAKEETWLAGADWAVQQIDRDHDDSYLTALERTLLRDMKVANPHRAPSIPTDPAA